MQFINSKQAYPIILGIALSILAIGVWQKFSLPTERYPLQNATANGSVAIAPSISSVNKKPVNKNLTSNKPQAIAPGRGVLRVGNLTEHPVRIVLQLRANSPNYKEPLNWDFIPKEGGDQGLQLSLPQDQIKVSKGDIIFAFATDGSRTYWGPNVVGESEAIVWQGDRWNFIIQP